jgi:hypothetical protein
VREDVAFAEFETLKQAYDDGAPVVNVLVEKHEASFNAYTLKPVGAPCSEHSRVNVSLLFSSLYELHSTGWYHGDARWQNAILFERQVRWCDFLWAKKSQPFLLRFRASDVLKLAESLLKRQGRTVPTLFTEMEQMLLSGDLVSYDEIAKYVSDALAGGRPPLIT